MNGAEWALTIAGGLILLLFVGLTYLVRLQHEIDQERDGAWELDRLEGEDRIERARRRVGAESWKRMQEEIQEAHR